MFDNSDMQHLNWLTQQLKEERALHIDRYILVFSQLFLATGVTIVDHIC